jgi:putrescine transport system permease protein
MSGAPAPRPTSAGTPPAPAIAAAQPRRGARIDWGRLAMIGVPYGWLIVLFAFPFVLVLKLSLSDRALAVPPFRPLIEWERGLEGILDFLAALDLESYTGRLIQNPIYGEALANSLGIASIATLILLLVGYPIAYAMARAPRDWRPWLVMAVILPFWTSFLIRVYAWVGILQPDGLLNAGLGALGLVDPAAPPRILFTDTAVIIGIVYAYLPFMVLPLYASLERMDHTLLEAAADLGCPPWKSFWLVTVPISLPGVFAGALLCFIPIMGEFVIPDLLGGPDTLMIGRTIWVEFFANRNWPVASAVAVVLLVLLIVPILLFQRAQERGLGAHR